MKKANIWMPLYIADYLADTNRLTTTQHGAYLLLIMDYWRNGSLPDDDAILAQITKMTPDAWSIARTVLVQFFSITMHRWVHGRIEDEMVKAGHQKQSAHNRAVKAAQARWGDKKNASSITSSVASRNPQEVLESCPSPSPSPSPSTSKAPSTSKEKSKTIAPMALLASLGITEQLAVDFIKLRTVKKAPITSTAMSGLDREAKKAGIVFEDAVKICCERGWAGFKAEWFFKDGGKVPDSAGQRERVREKLFGKNPQNIIGDEL